VRRLSILLSVMTVAVGCGADSTSTLDRLREAQQLSGDMTAQFSKGADAANRRRATGPRAAPDHEFCADRRRRFRGATPFERDQGDRQPARRRRRSARRRRRARSLLVQRPVLYRDRALRSASREAAPRVPGRLPRLYAADAVRSRIRSRRPPARPRQPLQASLMGHQERLLAPHPLRSRRRRRVRAHPVPPRADRGS